MSAAISPATSQNYGVQRVCRIWGFPRSSFYHAIIASLAAPRGTPWPGAAGGGRPFAEPPSKPTWRPRHSTVRGIAKSGRGCVMASGWWLAATACCG